MTNARGDASITQRVEHVPTCGHHGTRLTFITDINPETHRPWRWRCRHCFPEAFPRHRTADQRLRDVQQVIAFWSEDLNARHAYSGDPCPGGTRLLRRILSDLKDAVAEWGPDSRRSGGSDE